MWDSIPKIRVLLYDVTIRCNVEEINFGFWGSKMPAAAGGLPTAADGRSVPYFSTFYSNRTGLRPNSREVPRKSKLWALPLLSMFQSYFQWMNIINPSSTLHIRCLFWWKKEDLYIFPKMAKGSRWWPLYRRDKNVTYGRLTTRQDRTAACQTAGHTNNQPSVRSATPKALPRR